MGHVLQRQLTHVMLASGHGTGSIQTGQMERTRRCMYYLQLAQILCTVYKQTHCKAPQPDTPAQPVLSSTRTHLWRSITPTEWSHTILE